MLESEAIMGIMYLRLVRSSGCRFISLPDFVYAGAKSPFWSGVDFFKYVVGLVHGHVVNTLATKCHDVAPLVQLNHIYMIGFAVGSVDCTTTFGE